MMEGNEILTKPLRSPSSRTPRPHWRRTSESCRLGPGAGLLLPRAWLEITARISDSAAISLRWWVLPSSHCADHLGEFGRFARLRPGRRACITPAILYPTRAALAGSPAPRAGPRRIPLEGACDHGRKRIHYLLDPDGNGVELTWHRPREQWTRSPKTVSSPCYAESWISEELLLHRGPPADPRWVLVPAIC